uniref:Uncharacterized protein n=1 Tax=Romanomermis culicivorax TaxID=13658 RepID=A0A915ISA7_ROMCU
MTSSKPKYVVNFFDDYSNLQPYLPICLARSSMGLYYWEFSSNGLLATNFITVVPNLSDISLSKITNHRLESQRISKFGILNPWLVVPAFHGMLVKHSPATQQTLNEKLALFNANSYICESIDQKFTNKDLPATQQTFKEILTFCPPQSTSFPARMISVQKSSVT